jgi:RimJ/RimL family protein N-acetyltransferase
MLDTSTMRQTKRLLQATLEVPREFWRGHEHVRETAAASDEAAVGHNEQAFTEAEARALKVGDAQEPHMIPVRALSVRHRRLIKGHLLALSAQDRYLRFGYMANDEQVASYVANLNFERDEIYGIFNRRLQLIAMAHLALQSDPKCESCAEFGVSVSSDARGKGLGTLLFKRAMLHAQAANVDLMFIHALSENEPMLKIARKAGAVIESYGGEVEAHIRLPVQDFADRVETAVKDAVADGIGIVDFRLKLRALQFWEFLASLQSIRKGAIAAQNTSAP